MFPKTEKRQFLADFLLKCEHIARSDKKEIGKTYFVGAIQTASKKYVPFSNPGRDQCQILNTCRLIYSEILMVQSKDFLDSLGFCKSDKGSIGKIYGEVAVFFH